MELALYWMDLAGIKSPFCRYMDDSPMAELPFTRNATVRKLEDAGGSGAPPLFQPGPEGAKVCAYNYTCQRFLSAAVEAGDFSPVILNRRLPTLTAGSGAALWIVPFRGISPTSVRFPVDLVLLNSSGVVLQTVQSFPISQPSGAPAASVLVLPEQTISATGTSSGDQLLLCPSEEMKQRLQKMAQASAESEVQQEAPEDPNAPKAAGNVLPWVGRSRPVPVGDSTGIVENPVIENVPVVEEPRAIEKPPRERSAVVEVAPVEVAPPAPEVPAPSVPAPAASPVHTPWGKRHKRPKNWFEKLLSPEPSDPRKAPREELPWLGAYFFTGGKPVAYPIRDISAVGVYVLTEERWYPGTVLRVTLVDRRQPTPDRSFTVNAKVVRPAGDGVGLEFVLNDDLRARGKSDALDSQVAGVDRAEVEDFLSRVRATK